MELPRQGRPVDDVIADLEQNGRAMSDGQDGKTFGMVYDGGPTVHEVAERAALLYLHENALNTKAFPSLGQIQSRGGRAGPRGCCTGPRPPPAS